MKAFFLKMISFFRTIISTMRNKKSFNVKLEVDSNHDGKPDITLNVDSDGSNSQPEK